MFLSLGDMSNSKPSMNFGNDSSLHLSSPSSIEHSRQSWKPTQAIKPLLVSCLNTTLSMEQSSFTLPSTMQRPSPHLNAIGQSTTKNSSPLWIVSGSGEIG